MLKESHRIIAGTVIWLIVLIGFRPSLLAPVWAVVLLLLAVLVLVPLGLSLVDLGAMGHRANAFLLPAAISLAASFLLPDGLIASILAVPWLVVTVTLALMGVRKLLEGQLIFSPKLAISAGLIYLPVGGIWAQLARMGVRPLNFSDDIVMLTAVHFHYAGFLLPVLCGLVVKEKPGRLATTAVFGVVGGVPLTAVGITLSQLGVGFAVELISAWITAAAGLLTAGLYLGLALDGQYQPTARVFWGVTAACLTVGMVLAATYGSRQLVGVEWLTIPWMRALHGTANSVGFALAGLLGWKAHQ